MDGVLPMVAAVREKPPALDEDDALRHKLKLIIQAIHAQWLCHAFPVGEGWWWQCPADARPDRPAVFGTLATMARAHAGAQHTVVALVALLVELEQLSSAPSIRDLAEAMLASISRQPSVLAVAAARPCGTARHHRRRWLLGCCVSNDGSAFCPTQPSAFT
jgi:hypothetical protein